MPLRNWQGGGAPNPGDWDQANNWVGGVVPIDGDTVDFLAGNWVADPTAGPAAAVTLISIVDDAGFEAMGGANAVICYANITVTTVTVLSACFLDGGVVNTATLTGTASRVQGGTYGTINMGGQNGRVYSNVAAVTADTVNMTGTDSVVQGAGFGFALTVGDIYLNAGSGYARFNGDNGGAVTNIYMQNNNPQIHINAATVTNVYVSSADAEIGAAFIAGGFITNGPYVMGRNLVLSDYTTGEVMCDTNWVLLNHEGRW